MQSPVKRLVKSPSVSRFPAEIDDGPTDRDRIQRLDNYKLSFFFEFIGIYVCIINICNCILLYFVCSCFSKCYIVIHRFKHSNVDATFICYI